MQTYQCRSDAATTVTHRVWGDLTGTRRCRTSFFAGGGRCCRQILRVHAGVGTCVPSPCRRHGLLHRLDDHGIAAGAHADPLAVHARGVLDPAHIADKGRIGGGAGLFYGVKEGGTLRLPCGGAGRRGPGTHRRAFSGSSCQVRHLEMSCSQPGSVSYTT